MNNMKRNNVWLAAMISGLVMAGAFAPAQASSHREAPFLTNAPKVDGTDFYMFRSYAPGRDGFVTMIANFIPFQDPQGGPNFYQFDQNALYEIHVDNNGDAKEDLTFQFRFKNTSKNTALTIGGKSVMIPLINSSTITGVNPASLNVRETYTIDMVKGDRRGGTRTRLACHRRRHRIRQAGRQHRRQDLRRRRRLRNLCQPAHLRRRHAAACGTGRVFVGQRKEPFYIAVGKIFDLFNLNPLGPEIGGNKNDLEGKNVSSIAIEMPIACLTNGTEPVIGAYATASMRQGRLLNPAPAPA